MGLRSKILAGFLVLALMLFVAGVWSIYQLSDIGSSVQKLMDDNYRSIRAAEMMLQAIERQDSGILLLLLGRWEEGRETLDAAATAFEEGYEIARNNLTIQGEGDYVNQIHSRYEGYKDLWKRPIVGTDREGDLNWYLTNMHAKFLDVKRSINDLKAINEKALYQMASDLKNRANRAAMPGIVAIISALLFSLIFSYFVHHFMVSPIIRITKAIEDYIEKGTTFNAKIETRDEIFHLASAIKTLCSRGIVTGRGR